MYRNTIVHCTGGGQILLSQGLLRNNNFQAGTTGGTDIMATVLGDVQLARPAALTDHDRHVKFYTDATRKLVKT